MKLTKYNRQQDLDHSWFILFWGVSNFIQYKMYQLQYEGGKKRWHEGVRQVPNFKGFNHQLNIANSHLGLNCFKIGFFFKASKEPTPDCDTGSRGVVTGLCLDPLTLWDICGRIRNLFAYALRRLSGG